MKEDNKNTELNDTDKKLLISDVIDSRSLESFYTEYDNWCENLWAGQFYVKWLKRDEFFESIKTYDDWINLQKEVGLIEDDMSW
jgi:hypothetical protein